MITVGCDIGSLTAKAVIIKNNKILASSIIRVKASPLQSSKTVIDEALKACNLEIGDVDNICSTGYGRFDLSFAPMNKSEISCHGMGAFWLDNSIRTIIDIGGQDCKVIVVDNEGMLKEFIMNDKCAAGTGRNLEILANDMGVDVSKLGTLSLKSKKRNLEITNKCSIFMEMEVFRLIYSNTKIYDIAYAINHAISKRIVQLTTSINIKDNICVTGGVSKNKGIINILGKLIDRKLIELPFDPQLVGAVGAAIFAAKELSSCKVQLQAQKNDEVLKLIDQT